MKKLIIFLLIAAPIVMNAQMTYVPDDNFEQALIDLGLDTPPLNDSIATKNIDTVTYLDVYKRNIKDLTGIEDFKALTELFCHDNLLTSLDVSKNTALTWLFCPENKLSSLDVSKNIALTYLNCHDNALKSLDVSKNTALTDLACSHNALKSLDVSNNTALVRFGCFENDLTSLDISKNPALTDLLCHDNTLKSLDVSKNTALIWLYCHYNPDLLCIQVADSIKAANNKSWNKDSTAHYSENCNYTGVEDNKFENEAAAISPNPAQDYIEISLPPRPPGEGRGEGIRIYNMLGEIVSGLDTPPDPLFLEGGKCRIDVSGLVPGVYFVRIGDEVRKFIKI